MVPVTPLRCYVLLTNRYLNRYINTLRVLENLFQNHEPEHRRLPILCWKVCTLFCRMTEKLHKESNEYHSGDFGAHPEAFATQHTTSAAVCCWLQHSQRVTSWQKGAFLDQSLLSFFSSALPCFSPSLYLESAPLSKSLALESWPQAQPLRNLTSVMC